MNNKNIVAIIPARGGSKSIHLKNIKPINGKPLIYWSIDAAIACEYINMVYISTEDGRIKDSVDKYITNNSNNINIHKVKCINRSKTTATDVASTESVMLEFAEKYEFTDIVLIQATSPLIKSKDLNYGIQKYLYNNYDSLLSVVKQKRFLWSEIERNLVSPQNYDYLNRPRRQDFKGFLAENGAFYITKKELLLKTNSRISGNIGFYEMDEKTYYEIDEPDDWNLIENIMSNDERNRYKLSMGLNNIKMVLTDCDGVLTNGGMYYGQNGEELKRFNSKDGMAFELLKQKNIITGIVTGEKIELVKKRAEKLNVDELYMGAKNKLKILEILVDKYNIAYSEVAYIGDDINDIDVIKKVGFGCCVQNAVEDVKKVSKYITKLDGGKGAFREMVEIILNG